MRHLALKCLTGIPTIFSSSSRDKKLKITYMYMDGTQKKNKYVHGSENLRAINIFKKDL